MRRAFVLFSLLIVSGCGKEEPIVRYKAPKDPSWRTLGAILPRPNEVWFIKMVSSTARVEEHKAPFLSFVKSLTFDDRGMKWDVPEGWTEEPGGGTRFATLRFGEDKPLMEVSVVRLPGDAGGLPADVNRWRNQLGLDPETPAEIEKKTGKLQVAGSETFLVDLIGPLRPAGGAAMRGGGMPASRPEPPPSSGTGDLETVRKLFSYTLPPDWVQNPNPDGRRIFEFKTVGGGQSAEVTFNILPGSVGGLAANINRWRGQAGMPPVDDSKAHDLVTHFDFLRGPEAGGHGAHLVEFIGKDRAILCIFRLSEQFSMFLKMDGPPEIVVSQRESFKAFASSMKMGGRR